MPGFHNNIQRHVFWIRFLTARSSNWLCMTSAPPHQAFSLGITLAISKTMACSSDTRLMSNTYPELAHSAALTCCLLAYCIQPSAFYPASLVSLAFLISGAERISSVALWAPFQMDCPCSFTCFSSTPLRPVPPVPCSEVFTSTNILAPLTLAVRPLSLLFYRFKSKLRRAKTILKKMHFATVARDNFRRSYLIKNLNDLDQAPQGHRFYWFEAKRKMASMPQRLGRARPLEVTISHWIHLVERTLQTWQTQDCWPSIKTTIKRFHQRTEGLEDRNLSSQAVAAWATDYQMAIQYHHDTAEKKPASCE